MPENSPGPSKNIEDDRLIDAICDRFEKECRTGKRPVIESQLSAVEERLKQFLILELIPIDAHYRQKSGETVSIADYQQRFPEQCEALYRAHLDTNAQWPQYLG